MEQVNLLFIHDRFFKNSMGRKSIAQGFAQLFLCGRVAFKINYKSFQIVKDSWINALFAQHSSDVLYRAEIEGTRQHLLLLFEHKSYVDDSVALENYQNTSEAIEEEVVQRKSSRKKLPPVVPIIVYHGNDAWNADNSLTKQFEFIEGAEQYVPQQGNIFIDLSTVPDEQIAGIAEVKAFVLALKYSRSPRLFEKIHEIIRVFDGVGPYRLKYLEVVIHYLKYAIPESDRAEFSKRVEKELELGDEHMKKSSNIWAELGYDAGLDDGLKKGEDIGFKKGENEGLQKGEKIGVKKGIQYEKQNEKKNSRRNQEVAAIKMLKKKLSIKDISDFTGLTIKEVSRLKKKVEKGEL